MSCDCLGRETVELAIQLLVISLPILFRLLRRGNQEQTPATPPKKPRRWVEDADGEIEEKRVHPERASAPVRVLAASRPPPLPTKTQPRDDAYGPRKDARRAFSLTGGESMPALFRDALIFQGIVSRRKSNLAAGR